MLGKRSGKRRAVVISCLPVLAIIAFFVYGIYHVASYLFGFPSINYQVDSSTQMITYDDPSLNFVIGYPSSWSSRSVRGQFGDRTVKAIISAPGAADVTIRVREVSEQVSLEQIMLDREQRWKADRQVFGQDLSLQVVSLTPEPIDNLPALVAQYDTEALGKTVLDQLIGANKTHVMEVYFRNNEQASIVTFETDKSTFLKLESIFRKMIQSIHFRRR
jgi:hypothetical protein